jgi:uncharacterized protein YdeI (YjbR/CyaY-like superfamily)
MKNANPKFDEYIAKSADFAKPILNHLRQLIHDTCPDVEEIMKWSIPHFDYKGEMMCILAAYGHHCSFTFWKADLMSDQKLRKNVDPKQPLGYMSKIASMSDLPSDDQLVAYIKEAMALNENGVKLEAKPKSDKPRVIETPDYFNEKLATNPAAKEIFETKSAAYRKEYLIWITDAKTEATRQKRMEESLEWIAEGKGRFWKYEK